MYQGVTHALNHLDAYEFTVTDTRNVERRIAVSFSDHCFTRTPAPGDDPALAYPDSLRCPGHFCFIRYHLSLGLAGHIARAVDGSVWIVEGADFAVLSVLDQSGRTVHYCIMFGLDSVTGLPVHLHMRVETAYPLDKGDVVTYGKVGFRLLVTLRMDRKMPHRQGGKKKK